MIAPLMLKSLQNTTQSNRFCQPACGWSLHRIHPGKRKRENMNDQRAIQVFLDAVGTWDLDNSSAASLVGSTSSMIGDWRSGNSVATTEEILVRMLIVAHIRTALDICWSEVIAKEWIRLPNRGEPYKGLSPAAYIAEHGWPGLYWVLCQVQACAVGNL